MFSFRRRIFLMLALCGLAWALPLGARQPDTGFLNRTVAVDGVTYNYQVFVPSNWSKKVKWPVILFLHGRGRWGYECHLNTILPLYIPIEQLKRSSEPERWGGTSINAVPVAGMIF